MTYTGFIGTFGVLYHRFLQKVQKEGFFVATWYMCRLFCSVLFSPLYSYTRGRETFQFRGQSYHYFCHWYNTTFDNERALEVAILLQAVQDAQAHNGNVLEIGNVFSHYTDATHDILDKYEKGERVIHEDVADYSPQKKYNLIFSISTIEHVGWDEHPKDPKKITRALQNLESMLAPGGLMIITVPVDYNPHMDEIVRSGMFLQEQHCFKRISKQNIWEPVSEEEALQCKYNKPYPFANALVIGVLQK